MKRSQGFTLIELIVVIVILGILAATALPKFIDMGSDARISVIKSVEGSMRSANTMIYAKAATAGMLGAASATMKVTIGGQDVLLDYGFAKDGTNLALAMDLGADITATATAFQHAKATTPASCQVAYAKATGANAPPTYTLTISGC